MTFFFLLQDTNIKELKVIAGREKKQKKIRQKILKKKREMTFLGNSLPDVVCATAAVERA
jgi:hypothetical protein